MQKRTKIVATIGPACKEVETLVKMIEAGMNVARLNFSHGTHDEHAKLIQNIREAAQKTGKVIAIMQDLQGPKIRVAEMPEKGVELKEGEQIIFDTGADMYIEGIIPVGFKELHLHVKVGERLLLNDGRVETMVESVEGTKIKVRIKNSGLITSHKGINIPDSGLTISALTEKDKQDAAFGVEHSVDIIALSFVTRAKDVIELRELIHTLDKNTEPIHIITKIERGAAIEHIDEILEAADGIMVARGDLGIEIPAAHVPIVQKTLITKALHAAKPVIVATQMLDSMQENPRPTRAEVSDVANAVIDHADAVMLSNETATGKYPVETIETMRDIIIETENSGYDDLSQTVHEPGQKTADEAMTEMARLLADQVDAKCILAASLTGTTARLISHQRPELPILVATNNPRVEAQLNLVWGVLPFHTPACKTVTELIAYSTSYIKEHNLAVNGDTIIAVEGGDTGSAGTIQKIELLHI